MAVRAFNDRFGSGFGGPLNVGTLLLKVGTVGPEPAYQDGDIVCAFNRRRTRHVHANALCHPRRAQRQSNGLIAIDHVSRHYMERVHQYKFERVNHNTVVRTNLWTGDVDVVGATPNDKGEVIDVDLYVRRRRQAQGFGLFGSEGAEVWYGGSQRLDNATMTAVWNAIEEHSPEREANYGLWPLGTEELKHFLAIHVDDFDDAEEQALVAPEVDDSDPENVITIRTRHRHLPWRELRGMTSQRIAQVTDRNIPIDIRSERKHVRSQQVRVRHG